MTSKGNEGNKVMMRKGIRLPGHGKTSTTRDPMFLFYAVITAGIFLAAIVRVVVSA